MTLAGEDGRNSTGPDIFDRRQDSDLVIDQDIMLGRIPLLNIVKLKFFMYLDENVLSHRLETA